MRRLHVMLLAAAGIVVFLLVSALLARAFSAEGAERSAITSVVQAEARGDATAVIGEIDGCGHDPGCSRRMTAVVANLRRRGSVAIIQIQTSAGFSLAGTRGTARVAWRVGGSLPIVQCLRVQRSGNVLSGLELRLLRLSERIASNAACPARF